MFKVETYYLSMTLDDPSPHKTFQNDLNKHAKEGYLPINISCDKDCVEFVVIYKKETK